MFTVYLKNGTAVMSPLCQNAFADLCSKCSYCQRFLKSTPLPRKPFIYAFRTVFNINLAHDKYGFATIE